MENFYTILTDTGKAKIANAHANRTTLELKEMAVGDGAGAYYNPSEKLTALKNEVYRRELNNLSVDPDNLNYLLCEMVIPSDAGGFYIREAAIFDTDGDMIAIGKIPETYKPTLSAGAAKDLYMKFIIEVTNTAAVTLKIDPSVVLATKEMAEQAATNAVIAHVGQGNPHNQYVAKTTHTTDIANLQTALNSGLAGKENAFTVLPVGKGGTGRTNELDAARNLNFMRYGGWRPEWDNDANKVNESCVLRDFGGKNSPAGLVNGQLVTFYDGYTDTMGQLYIYHDRGVMFVRSATSNGTNWSTWKYLYGDKDVIPTSNGGTGHSSGAPLPPHQTSTWGWMPIDASTGSFQVPAGGTWALFYVGYYSSGVYSTVTKVAAGGTSHPVIGDRINGFMWQIA